MSTRVTQLTKGTVKGDWAGVHLSANMFVANILLWLILRTGAGLT